MMEPEKNNKLQVQVSKLREAWGGGELSNLPTLVTHLKDKVDDIRNTRYKNMDIERNMRDLTLAGDGLFQALSAAKVSSAKCTKDIMKVLTEYQSLVAITNVASGQFTHATIVAIKEHMLMIKAFEKNKPEVALAALKRTGDLAQEMVVETQVLIDKSTELEKWGKDAQLAAEDDMYATAEAKKANAQKRAARQARQATLKQNQIELAEMLDAAKEDQRKAAADAESARSSALIAGIFGGITSTVATICSSLTPLGAHTGASASMAGRAGTMAGAGSTAAAEGTAAGNNTSPGTSTATSTEQTTREKDCAKKQGELAVMKNNRQEAPEEQQKAYNKDIESKEKEIAVIQKEIEKMKCEIKEHFNKVASTCDDKEAQASKQKFEIMRNRAQEASELAGVLEELKGLAASNDDLERAFKGLELAILILGRVKTTFTMVLAFWKGVHAHCKDLTAIELIVGELQLADSPEEWLPVVADNIASWACLGNICNLAHNVVGEALESLNGNMRSLPSREQANALLNSNMGPLLQRIKEDEDHCNTEAKLLGTDVL